jgi:hypothetical protein
MRRSALGLFLLLLTMAASCGDSGSPAEDFVGTWSSSGTLTASANGQSNTVPITGNRFIVAEGHTITISDSQCNIPAKVTGTVAAIQNYTCTMTSADGTESDTYTGGTMTLAGNVINFNINGTFTLTDTTGASLSGTFVETGSLTKVGN